MSAASFITPSGKTDTIPAPTCFTLSTATGTRRTQPCRPLGFHCCCEVLHMAGRKRQCILSHESRRHLQEILLFFQRRHAPCQAHAIHAIDHRTYHNL